MHLWSCFDGRYGYACLVECFQSTCNAFNDDIMCLLPISLLWFNDSYVVALFDMICDAMLGWCDEM